MILYPRHLTLELTAKCNFRCPYCYCVWHEFPALGCPELDADGWLRVLDKCAADGVKDILFSGGEALLRKDLFEIVDAARARLPDASFSLFTNASRLTAPLIDSFKERRVSLATSLQGLRTYGKMTGTRRKFNRLLSILATASEREWPMAVSMTITKANCDEAADMFVAAALSGASRIQMGAMMAEGRGRDCLDLMLTREEWGRVKMSIRELPDAHVPIRSATNSSACVATSPKLFFGSGPTRITTRVRQVENSASSVRTENFAHVSILWRRSNELPNSKGNQSVDIVTVR